MKPDEPILGDYRGYKVTETEHMSVPQLAQHLMPVLSDRTGLLFSATVYRYRLDAPWIMEVTVSGVPAGEADDPRLVEEHVAGITWELELFNYSHHGRYRFVPIVLVLRACERHLPEPGRVVVRRLHLRPRPFRRTWARVWTFLSGCML